MRAEAGGSYDARDALYQRLTAESYINSPHYIKGWFLRAVNDFEEAQKTHSSQLFAKAADSFEKARQLLRGSQDEQASLCLKYRVQALSGRGGDGQQNTSFAGTASGAGC